jgi:murein L,D-transpeptidase YcbB/YkuD
MTGGANSSAKRSRGRGEKESHPLLTRRSAAKLLAAGAASLIGFPAAAQEYWWERIPGFGTPGGTYASHASERRTREVPAQLNDLRTDQTPLRSEQMLSFLNQAMARYMQIAQRGGWPTIPGNRMIRPGDDDERVPAVRRRLIISGDLRNSSGYDTYSYDGELEAAVRHFQTRHGLRVSGRIDQPTLQAMNVPAQARAAQLKLNMDRINDLIGQRVEDRYILVNVPGFQLEAVDHGVVEQRHRVIAGKPERQTPVVKAQVRALNFFPYWRVPDSVAKLDLIPRLRREPDYLDKEMIRVLKDDFNGPVIDSTNIDWRQADPVKIKFRQDPGPQNALGLVRLDMPNEHGVYMHDTPMKPLFGQRSRAFSAGCVRVQDVFDLAAWVARDEPGMDRQRIDQILAAGTAVNVNLQHPVPVYFTYITAWAEQSGYIEFRPDIYGRDGLRELSADRERDPEAPMPIQALAP